MPEKEVSRSSSTLPKNASDNRKAILKLLKSKQFDNTMGFIICCYFLVVIAETDLVAQNLPAPLWAKAASWAVLIIFVVELVLRLYVFGSRFFCDRWSVFDFVIISVDLIGSVVGLLVGQKVGVGALRVLRLSRLARVSKVLKAFPELRLMVAGLLGAMNSIFWGTLFLLVALLIWSVIAVQFIHPLNKELTDKGFWKDAGCDRCPRAFESVFQSTLTFTQQIVAGDSWGQVTVPIIEQYPASGLFFMGVLLSVGLAILNLILGVVVNVATLESDKLRDEMENERHLETQQHIIEILSAMDEDGSNELNKDEIVAGYRTNQDFREVLDSMGLEEDDIQIVWAHLDADGDGTIGPKEFAVQLVSMDCSNTQFMLSYIKHYIKDMKRMLSAELSILGKGVKQELDAIESEMHCIESEIASPEKKSKAIDENEIVFEDHSRVKEPASNGVLHSDIEASVMITRLHGLLHEALDSVVDIWKRSPALHQSDGIELPVSTISKVKTPSLHPLNRVSPNKAAVDRSMDKSKRTPEEHNFSREMCEMPSRGGTDPDRDRRTLLV